MVRDPRRVEVYPISHPKGCRSYVVVDPVSRHACVVDPLLDQLRETISVLAEHGAELRWIVDTHSHGDHLSGAAALKARAGGEVVMHPAAPSEVATVRPPDGATLEFGEHGLKVHHAPGNTADALVLEAEGALFSGDTLLIGTVGLRDAPGADPKAHFDSLNRIFGGRPETTVIHPGHDDMGRTMTTLKSERRGNGWLRQDDFEAFLAHFRADDRPVRKEASALLEANRQGLLRVPKDLEPASGLLDPARRKEAEIRADKRLAVGELAPQAAPIPAGLGTLLVMAGLGCVLATILGWFVLAAFHAISIAIGILFVGIGIRSWDAHRARKGDGPGLYYTGPVKHKMTS
jgi:glyoxylase-like metal-dependent hydrolase (beta-lactamase superfamily II)